MDLKIISSVCHTTLLPGTHNARGGKVIGVGVHMYIYMCVYMNQNNFELYFCDRTFPYGND